MLFKTQKHIFLTALVAILTLTSSAECWGMNLFEKQWVPNNMPTVLNSMFKEGLNDFFSTLEPELNKNNEPLNKFKNYLLSFIKSDVKINGFWRKTGNIIKNFSKCAFFTGLAAFTHCCALPNATKLPIHTALCYGVMALGYTLGGAAAIRMVQAPFINGWNIGSGGELYKLHMKCTDPNGKKVIITKL